MKTFDSLFKTIYIAISLLTNAYAYTYPLISRLDNDPTNPQTGWDLGYITGEQYAAFDPSSYADYIRPSIVPTRSLDGQKLDMNRYYFSMPRDNGQHQQLDGGYYIYENDRANNTFIDPEFFSEISEINSTRYFDEASDRSNNPNIDFQLMNGIYATLLEISKEKRATNETNSTVHRPHGCIDLRNKPSRYDSGHLLRPAPMPLMQNIQQSQFMEPVFYSSNYPAPLLPFTIAPSSSLAVLGPQSGFPNAPSSLAVLGPQSGFPITYTSPDSYLQPMYAAPAPFQVWPFSVAGIPVQNDTKIVNSKPSAEISQNKKPVETNLTKVHIDPITEKRKNLHSHPFFGTNIQRVEAKNKNLPLRSRTGPHERSIAEYYEQEQKRPGRLSNIPFVKKVLVPVNVAGNRVPATSNRFATRKASSKPRYKVMYHLQKTYVPISS